MDAGRGPLQEAIEIQLNDEERAAVEGWQRANQFNSIADAARELLRKGLLSEISRSYKYRQTGEEDNLGG